MLASESESPNDLSQPTSQASSLPPNAWSSPPSIPPDQDVQPASNDTTSLAHYMSMLANNIDYSSDTFGDDQDCEQHDDQYLYGYLSRTATTFTDRNNISGRTRNRTNNAKKIQLYRIASPGTVPHNYSFKNIGTNNIKKRPRKLSIWSLSY